ncbi:MAG TPA: TIGR03960 family B12-binding radical SAM protein [Clostridia bacterium]|nr:TIGR03960 family B12-binding radical SAM protein [Clostridia bacterium]
MRQLIEDRLLPQVLKPARYLGTEWNAVHKDWDRVPVKMAFAFPDVYEIGMSHLGLQIIYGLVNGGDDFLLERVFAPGRDMEELMRAHRVPLFSLESYRPLKEFDVIGFTLQYEMSFTNILNMLDLAGIPVRAEYRGEQYPLVIGGGPCASNPEPLVPFFDAFLLGDGEILLPQFLDLLKSWKDKHGGIPDKEQFLLEAARLPGVYVPRFYDIRYGEDGSIVEIRRNRAGVPPRVARQVVSDLDRAYFPTHPIVPYLETVHDRAMLEVLRGCTRGCRFCQAGILYRPVRERDPELLARQAEELLKATGHEEISLTSLSTADYTCLEPLIKLLMDKYQGTGTSVSLPSLRADAFSVHLAKELQRGRKSGLTFAPEAGTQRLRDVINKGVRERDLMEAVTAAFEAGWTGIKLYFMLGLPTETREDLDGIRDLAEKVMEAGRRISKEQGRTKKVRVTVSVSTYVPKAHTPFQWEAQIPLAEVKARQHYLKSILKKGITYNYHDAELSFLEAVFAKGDRRLGEALERAWELGCKFDSWREHFSFARWMQAFRETGIDPAFYANRPIPLEAVLPWEHLDMGVSKRFLLREREKAFQGVLTRDCREGRCTGCEVCGGFGVDLVLKGGKGHAGPAGV